MDKQKSTQNLEYPRNKGQNTILRPGLELTVEVFKPPEDCVINLETGHSSLEFRLCLSGKIRGNMQGLKDEIALGANQSAVWFNPKSRITMEYLSKQFVRCVAIKVKPHLLNALIENQHEWLPADLGMVIKGCEEKCCCHIGEMTSLMRIPAHQILNCPYHGVMRRIYLEGKTLELLAHLMVAFYPDNLSILCSKSCSKSCPKSCLKSCLKLCHEERQKLLQAKTILIKDLKKPPSLVELSRKVGLNDFKLKKGFRQVYGTTVFGYLRKHRMEYARQLLEEGEMNVTEVSYFVGYCSLSHFAKAFSLQFGEKPGCYLRRIRKKRYMPLPHHQNPSTAGIVNNLGR